jgi:hypothetical protein
VFGLDPGVKVLADLSVFTLDLHYASPKGVSSPDSVLFAKVCTTSFAVILPFNLLCKGLSDDQMPLAADGSSGDAAEET